MRIHVGNRQQVRERLTTEAQRHRERRWCALPGALGGRRYEAPQVAAALCLCASVVEILACDAASAPALRPGGVGSET